MIPKYHTGRGMLLLGLLLIGACTDQPMQPRADARFTITPNTSALAAAGKAIFFMSADNCRFRAPVRPGDVVRMPVKVVRHRGDVFKFAGQAMVANKVAAECEFAAMVVET